MGKGYPSRPTTPLPSQAQPTHSTPSLTSSPTPPIILNPIPQLAFLVAEGTCAAAVTEDSDLLAYGCPYTLFKLDVDSGNAKLVNFEELRFAEDRLPPPPCAYVGSVRYRS